MDPFSLFFLMECFVELKGIIVADGIVLRVLNGDVI